MKIIDKAIKRLPIPEKGSKIHFDDEVKGFGIRITAKGAKAFVLSYRIYGRLRRYTIGRTTEWSSEAARDEAIGLRKGIAKGCDPLQEKETRIASPTVKDLSIDYMSKHATAHKRASSQKTDQQLLDNHILPKLGRLKVLAVSYSDIERLHQSMQAKPYSANRVLALLHKMFSLAIKWQWCDKNPVKGIQRFPEAKRERYLSPAELEKLVDTLNEYPKFTTLAGESRTDARKQQSANIIKLLLLTGARKSEVLLSTWDMFDLKAGVWIKPSSHTKQKKIHRVPLSEPAIDLLTTIKNDSRYVFPGTSPDTPQLDVKGAWREISKKAGISDVRLHDLRHTYASLLVSKGLSLPIIGQLLGHTQPGTTARYAHLYDDALREATGHVGDVVSIRGVK